MLESRHLGQFRKCLSKVSIVLNVKCIIMRIVMLVNLYRYLSNCIFNFFQAKNKMLWCYLMCNNCGFFFLGKSAVLEFKGFALCPLLFIWLHQGCCCFGFFFIFVRFSSSTKFVNLRGKLAHCGGCHFSRFKKCCRKKGMINLWMCVTSFQFLALYREYCWSLIHLLTVEYLLEQK